MGRCSNDALLSKIGINKLEKSTEVDFAVLTDVERCMKVNALNYIEFVGTSATYNQYRVPADQFNCLAQGCRNTGTLMLTGAAGTGVSAKYAVGYDATEFYAGLVTYYIYAAAPGKYEITTTISDMTNQTQSNADVYTQKISVNEAGFAPIIVDFSKAPGSVAGNGWEASEKGAIISVEVKPDDATQIPNIGISSFYFYDCIEDLEVNDVVKIGCLDEITGTLTVDPVEAACWGAGYDQNSIAIERTITGKSMTPNAWKLNPLMEKTTKTSGWYIQGDEREVQTINMNGTDYGYIQVPDMQIDECAFTTAAIADECNVTNSTLSRVNTPVLVDLNERQFIVLDGTTTDPTDAGMLLFHPSLVGLKVIVSYPKKAVIEQHVASDGALNTRRVRMSFTVVQSDGVKIQYLYNNVLITSFPGTINGEETILEFTIAIQRDRNGRFYEENVITE